jgi:protein-S-isoprenylcysteine O-methyltransferase Ste14
VWESKRVRISQAGGLVLFLIARPVTGPFFTAGFLLIALGEALRLWAAGHIRKAAQLATDGPYALVRNPLYLGSLLLSCGFATMCTSARHWLSTVFVWAAVAATFGWLYREKIAMEEEDLRGRFGEVFDDYRRAVPAMVPTGEGLARAFESASFSWPLALKNKEHRTVLALLGLIAFLRMRAIYRL